MEGQNMIFISESYKHLRKNDKGPFLAHSSRVFDAYIEEIIGCSYRWRKEPGAERGGFGKHVHGSFWARSRLQ
jgi:hypothetical protein